MRVENPGESPTDIRAIVVMGVAGAGKTTVGRELAQAIGWEFRDADEFHSAANIAKMHRGEGLTDADRAPWLAALRGLIETVVREKRRVVLACSALKQAYRDMLRPDGVAPRAVRYVFLDVPADVLRERLEHRERHFAPPELLTSQLATLESPQDAVWVDGTCPVGDEVRQIREALEL
jgi:gluconokinase